MPFNELFSYCLLFMHHAIHAISAGIQCHGTTVPTKSAVLQAGSPAKCSLYAVSWAAHPGSTVVESCIDVLAYPAYFKKFPSTTTVIDGDILVKTNFALVWGIRNEVPRVPVRYHWYCTL